MAEQRHNNAPPFSVLAVTHAGESDENLRRFFDSLRTQTLPANEIILVIDGPINDARKTLLAELSHALPMRQFETEKSSHGISLNFGLTKCQHDLVMRCDSDDNNLPRRFEILLQAFLANDVSVCSGPIEEFQSDGTRKIRALPAGRITHRNLYSFFRSPINHNNCCYSKSAVIAAGGYQGGRLEDYKLWINMLRQRHSFYNVDAILLHADAERLSYRRGGGDFLRAEIRMFMLNAPRFWGLGVIPSLAALLLRAPLRLSMSRPILAFFYQTILRQKV
ncbi:glycosyl transferase [Amylibacter ulvae]|uniref:Glycosyl transferase n=1 Tax=Paramylibacter ulvae TaxID=1651968 RepID=A0ABQ3CZ88_9RHOB|nr:glycosyltransferase [Amylibacter ulvae]GHA48434.1 glycosyl transferase [Amylibacter ulvae]